MIRKRRTIRRRRAIRRRRKIRRRGYARSWKGYRQSIRLKGEE